MPYFVPVVCNNCGWSGTITIPRGQLAPSRSLCPRCGCNTVEKDLPGPPPAPSYPAPQLPIQPVPKYPWTSEIWCSSSGTGDSDGYMS